MKRVIESVHLVAEGRTGNLQLVLDFQEGGTLIRCRGNPREQRRRLAGAVYRDCHPAG
jgi:hypothetical protein